MAMRGSKRVALIKEAHEAAIEKYGNPHGKHHAYFDFYSIDVRVPLSVATETQTIWKRYGGMTGKAFPRITGYFSVYFEAGAQKAVDYFEQCMKLFKFDYRVQYHCRD